MKENLKPYVYKQTKHVKVRCGKIKYLRYEVEEKSSLKRAKKSYGIDPKPSDLSMSRLKLE